MQDRTIILYRDESLWEQRLQANTGTSASVILLGPGKSHRLDHPGPFAGGVYQEVSRRIRDTHRRVSVWIMYCVRPQAIS
jgi:hypothetical protein